MDSWIDILVHLLLLLLHDCQRRGPTPRHPPPPATINILHLILDDNTKVCVF